jgi:hypothetical protein
LFGYLKGEMAGVTANSPADILSEISWTFREISTETLVVVYAGWITGLEWITEHKGGYRGIKKSLRWAAVEDLRIHRVLLLSLRKR